MQETMATELINDSVIDAAIRASTAEVFSTMLALELEAHATQGGQTAGCTQSGVVALLGIAGDWVGSGSLSCDPELACRLASQLLMAEYETVNEDVLDAVAEVANMIIGNVKTAFEERVGTLVLSTPTVIFGRNFETRSVGNHDWVIVPFTCAGHTMHVQVSLIPNRNARCAKLGAGFPLTTSVAI